MIERWGVQLPEAHDLPALPRGIVLHWTGGGPRANSVDLGAYHYVVEHDGTVRAGVPVAANMRQLRDGDEYAAHTGGWNSFRIGLSAAGMKDYVARDRPFGHPLTTPQVFRMCELAAYFIELGNLDPSNPRHLCTHQEVWTIHGIKGVRNHEKTDIEYLPTFPQFDEHEVGPYLRHLTSELMAAEKEIARPPVIPEIVIPAPEPVDLGEPFPEPVLPPVERPRPRLDAEVDPLRELTPTELPRRSRWGRFTNIFRRIPMAAFNAATVMAKPWWMSKTLWLNALTILATLLTGLDQVIDSEILITALAAINFLLRLVTDKPVATSEKPKVVE